MMVTFHTHHFGALTPQWGEEESIPLLTIQLPGEIFNVLKRSVSLLGGISPVVLE